MSQVTTTISPVEEALLLAEQQVALKARVELLPFAMYTNKHYQPAWYHKRVCRLLEKFVVGEIPRLMLFMPPRHGKSQLVSRCLPAFILGRNPDATIIATSYSADLAQMMNRDVQRIMDSSEYQKTFPISSLSTENIRTVSGKYLRNSDLFEIVGRRGVYRCAGVGGSITGHGANYIIIDDPIKNLEEAHSITYREKLWGWYSSTLYTRLQGNPSGVLLTVTRWHEDDLAGRLLALAKADPDADQWMVVSFEGIKESSPTTEDPREEGEALWPEFFPVEKLNAIKASTTPQVWTSLYQQHPAPLTGGIYQKNWWRFWYPRGFAPPTPVTVKLEGGEIVECVQVELPIENGEQLQSWDLTFKDTKSSAYVAGQLWWRTKADSYLLDQVRDKADFPKTVGMIKAFTSKHPKAIAKLVEDKANGPAVISVLQSEIPGLIAINPQGGKEARAHASAHVVCSGNIYLPHPALYPWVNDFIEECRTFPNGAFKDQVDTMTQYLIHSYGHPTMQYDYQPVQNIVQGPNSWKRPVPEAKQVHGLRGRAGGIW